MAGYCVTISPKITPIPSWRRRLVVMVKEPQPGRVKTRLGRDIGMVEAARWFRHQALDLLARIDDPRWQTIVAVSPDVAGMKSRVWPAHLPRLAQGRGDLGARMSGVFDRLPRGPVAIIGADIPDISRAHIADAFRSLGRHDAVFGPASDGGYWLIGLKRTAPPPPGFLRNVRWSSAHALADSVVSLGGDRSIGYLDQLDDVDTGKDLARVNLR